MHRYTAEIELTWSLQLWTPVYAGVATAAQKVKRTFRASRVTGIAQWKAIASEKVAGSRYNRVSIHQTATNMS